MVLVRSEPTSWEELESLEEFQAFREKLLTHGWGDFLHSLQGHDELVSLKFALGFDGRRSHIGTLVFEVSEETIARVTKLLEQAADVAKTLR